MGLGADSVKILLYILWTIQVMMEIRIKVIYQILQSQALLDLLNQTDYTSSGTLEYKFKIYIRSSGFYRHGKVEGLKEVESRTYAIVEIFSLMMWLWSKSFSRNVDCVFLSLNYCIGYMSFYIGNTIVFLKSCPIYITCSQLTRL